MYQCVWLVDQYDHQSGYKQAAIEPNECYLRFARFEYTRAYVIVRDFSKASAMNAMIILVFYIPSWAPVKYILSLKS